MKTAYRSQPALDHIFAAADAKYLRIKTFLSSSRARAEDEAELERRLHVAKNELMRRLLQSHVTLRGMEQATGPVVGEDGIARTHVRETTRHLETSFGTVEVTRKAHSGRRLCALAPIASGLIEGACRHLDVSRGGGAREPRVTLRARQGAGGQHAAHRVGTCGSRPRRRMLSFERSRTPMASADFWPLVAIPFDSASPHGRSTRSLRVRTPTFPARPPHLPVHVGSPWTSCLLAHSSALPGL